MKKVQNGRLLLIPASEETRGHGTTGNASFYARELAAFLDGVPRRAPGATGVHLAGAINVIPGRTEGPNPEPINATNRGYGAT